MCRCYSYYRRYCNSNCNYWNSCQDSNWCGNCQNCNGYYTLSGTVYGVSGDTLANAQISYSYNGLMNLNSTFTDANGNYKIYVPANSSVNIQVIPGIGVIVHPAQYNLTNVAGDISGLDFTYTVV